MDKEKTLNASARDDLKDGVGDANKRSLAAGLWLSTMRAPGLEDKALLGQAWVASSQKEWTSALLGDIYNGPGGLTEFMTGHHLCFVPNLRLINGVAMTWFGGIGGITPDDVTARTP